MATIISCKDPGKPCVGAQCQPKSGLCLLVPHKAVTSCDDNDSCTVGDACSGNNADDATCVPGKKKDCDDQNPCTTNTCSAKSGCVSNVDKTYNAPCYTGPKATDEVGLCSKGKHGCKADATLGPCAGEILPAAAELCDGKDDDCDGDTDEGCGSVGWAFSQVGARLTGSGGKYRLDARSGVRVGGEASGGGKRHITWGLQAWISAWSAK